MNIKKLLKKNASYANYIEVLSEYFYKNAITLPILKKYNIKIQQYSPEIVETFFFHSNSIVKENIKNSKIYKKIYDDWRQTIVIFNEYHSYSDNEYLKIRLNAIIRNICLLLMK